MSKSRKEVVSKSMFLTWLLAGDSNIKCEKGKIVTAVYKYCPEVSYNKIMGGDKNWIKEAAKRSISNFCNDVSYINQASIFICVSLNDWCKKQILPESKSIKSNAVLLHQCKSWLMPCLFIVALLFCTVLCYKKKRHYQNFPCL